MATAPHELKSIREAAKAVRKSERYVREHFIDTLKVRAFRMGGTDKHPRLRVYVDELVAAVEKDSIYLPPGVTTEQEKRRRRPSQRATLHPAAAAM